MSWRSSTKIRYICAVYSPISLNFVSSLITSLSGKLSKVSNTRSLCTTELAKSFIHCALADEVPIACISFAEKLLTVSGVIAPLQ